MSELMRILQSIIGAVAVLAALLNISPLAKSTVTPLPEGAQTHSVTVMTYNVYWQRIEDERLKNVAQNILSSSPDVIGTQEATTEHLEYLTRYLPEYAYVGVARDDGVSQGEYAAVFYRTEKYELVDSGTFWLSETPEVPSIGWQADEYRICTYAVLKEKVSDFTFAVFNTHFDHRSVFARNHGSDIVIERAAALAADMPVFIMGDFNSQQTTSAYAKIVRAGYADSKYVADKTMDGCSFNEWAENDSQWNRQNAIDHIFISNRIHSDSYEINYSKIDGEYPSDHFPVVVKATMF